MPITETIMSPAQQSAVGRLVQKYISEGRTPEEARRMVCRAAARAISRERQTRAGLEGYISGQADYTLTDQVQKKAILIQSEISGIGKEEWDRALQSPALQAAGWTPWQNYNYDAMMSFWLANVKSILVLPSKVPTIEQVREVDRLAAGSERLVATVKQNVSAEAAARAEADRREFESMLKGTLKSPGSEGWKTFQAELADRASRLVSGGVGLATIAAIVAGILGIGLVASKAFGK